MIQHHGSFAISIPANWSAPQFQLGQMVQVRDRAGQITGLDHYTTEQAAELETSAGWWYFVLEKRTLSNGEVIADVGGYHESVIQAVPCMPSTYYEHPIAV